MADEPTTETTPEPVAPPAPAPNYGPWIGDLREVFGDDPEILGKADEYMRTRVQPRMTELEQDVANWNELRADLQADPEGTLAAVAEQLWEDDPDRVRAVAKALGITNEEAAEALAEAEEETPVEYPPEIQELIEEREQAKQAERYAHNVAELRKAHPDVEIDADLFAPFAAIAPDYNTALESYKSWQSTWESKYKPAEPDPAPEPETPAPIGSKASTTSTPPVAERYASMDEAMEAFMNDVRAARDGTPTPMGGV